MQTIMSTSSGNLSSLSIWIKFNVSEMNYNWEECWNVLHLSLLIGKLKQGFINLLMAVTATLVKFLHSAKLDYFAKLVSESNFILRKEIWNMLNKLWNMIKSYAYDWRGKTSNSIDGKNMYDSC